MKTININGKKYPFFKSANSEIMYAKKAAELAAKADDDIDNYEMIRYGAMVVCQGIKDAVANKSFIWKLTHRIPKPQDILRCMSSSEITDILVGALNENGTKDPNH